LFYPGVTQYISTAAHGSLKPSSHKYLLKEEFYPQITIRNGKTFDKLRDLLD